MSKSNENTKPKLLEIGNAIKGNFGSRFRKITAMSLLAVMLLQNGSYTVASPGLEYEESASEATIPEINERPEMDLKFTEPEDQSYQNPEHEESIEREDIEPNRQEIETRMGTREITGGMFAINEQDEVGSNKDLAEGLDNVYDQIQENLSDIRQQAEANGEEVVSVRYNITSMKVIGYSSDECRGEGSIGKPDAYNDTLAERRVESIIDEIKRLEINRHLSIDSLSLENKETVITKLEKQEARTERYEQYVKDERYEYELERHKDEKNFMLEHASDPEFEMRKREYEHDSGYAQRKIDRETDPEYDEWKLDQERMRSEVREEKPLTAKCVEDIVLSAQNAFDNKISAEWTESVLTPQQVETMNELVASDGRYGSINDAVQAAAKGKQIDGELGEMIDKLFTQQRGIEIKVEIEYSVDIASSNHERGDR